MNFFGIYSLVATTWQTDLLLLSCCLESVNDALCLETDLFACYLKGAWEYDLLKPNIFSCLAMDRSQRKACHQ